MRYGFEHYLSAGHGRAYLLVRSDPERYRDQVMEVCQKDYTFDMQMEGSRAFLTADLIRIYDNPKPFIDAAIGRFQSDAVDDAYAQIQYFADLLMELGEGRIVLEKYFDLRKKIMETPYEKLKEQKSHVLENYEYLAIKLIQSATWEMAEKIVEDMGRWYMRTGDHFPSREFLWFYACLEDEFGEEKAKEHIHELAKTSPEAAAFEAHDITYEWKPPVSSETPPTAEDVVKIFASGKALRAVDILHLGIRKMSVEEKKKLADRAVKTDSPVLRTQIVSLFMCEAMKWPLDISHLLAWCEEGDSQLREACEDALGFFESDAIREYAINNRRAELIIRNFRPEEENLLMAILESVEIDEEDANHWHSIGRAILVCDLPDRFLRWVYETTLCSFCRQSAVEELMDRGTLPESYKEECMWDANLDIRVLFEEQEE